VFPSPQLQMLRVMNLRLEKSVLRAVEESMHVKGQQATLERTRAKGKGRAIEVPAVLEWAPAKGIMRAWIIPAVSVLRAVEDSMHVKINQVSQNNLYVLYSFAFDRLSFRASHFID